jgi:hypothetical protein
MYINIGAIQSSIVDANLSTVTWVTVPSVLGQLSTSGKALLRDMGKTVYLPDPTVGAAGVGSQSTVLRKVQLVPSGTAGYYGTGANSSTEFYTGYIQLGGQTYGGGNGVPTAVARLN